MAKLKRELARRARGPVMNDEDWWRLVYDSEAKRLYVEHEWEHVDVRKAGKADKGTKELEIGQFLNEGGEGEAHRELVRLISGLFEERRDA